MVGLLFLLGEFVSELGFAFNIFFVFALSILTSFNCIETLLSYAPIS